MRRTTLAWLPLAVGILWTGSAAVPADAQIQVSGQIDLTATNKADTGGLNRNFRGDSPFNQVRGRFFGQHWVTERIGVFSEILFDDVSGIRIQGAYLVLNELAGREWLNVRAGISPSLIGSFGLRSTYFNSNPLLGVPMVWQYRTTLDGSGLSSAEDLVRRREQNVRALPILYDACWSLVWEVMGNAGIVEYSLGVTPGAMSNPLSAPQEEGIQVLGRVGVEPKLGLRLGLSAGIGPYLGGPKRDPLVEAVSYPGEPADYDQRLVGLDGEYSIGRLQIHSEGYFSSWEAPLVDDDLNVWGGYVEGAYDLTPRLLGALRVGALGFGEIETPAGTRTAWDDDVVRVESAFTYRVAREVHLRLGWQHTEFLTGVDESEDLFALQLRAVY
jgi:hypothetical protein